jgi:hypothetical protein
MLPLGQNTYREVRGLAFRTADYSTAKVGESYLPKYDCACFYGLRMALRLPKKPEF